MKLDLESDFMFTHTYIEDEAMGKCVPYTRIFGLSEEAALRRLGHKFRVLDDDGNVYFEGYSADDSSFEPLDYTRGSYGTTEIQYRNAETGKWESL